MSLIAFFIFGLPALDLVIYYCFHEIFGEKAAIFEQDALLRARALASRISTENQIPPSRAHRLARSEVTPTTAKGVPCVIGRL